jgi:MFS family permease
MGSTAQAVGLIAGIYAMCALCMRPFSGQIVDNENRIILLRIVIGIILISVFGLTQSKQYWFLVAFRGLNGLAWGIGSTLCMTIATGCFTEKNMAGGIGIYGIGQTIAQTVAPTLALPIASRLGYNGLYYINVLLISLCLMLTFFLKNSALPGKKRNYSLSIKNMVFVPAILPASVTLCSAIARSSVLAFLVIFAGTMNIENIGLFFTLQALVIFFTRPFISRMSDKYGILKLLIPCEILAVIAMIIIATAHSLPAFLIAAVIMGISSSGEQPILMAECVRKTDASMRGMASNTSYIGTDFGQFAGSNIAGFLVAYLSYRKMFIMAALPIILCTIIFVILYKKGQKNIEKACNMEDSE